MYVVVNLLTMTVHEDIYVSYNSLFFRIMYSCCFCFAAYEVIDDFIYPNVRSLGIDLGQLVIYTIYELTTVLRGKKFLRKIDLWISTCLNRGTESKIYRSLSNVYLWMWVVLLSQIILLIFTKRP